MTLLHPSKLAAIVVLALVAFLVNAAQSPDAGANHVWAPQLYISEVHPVADPEGLPIERVEWVELHNPSHQAVSLDGWFIEDSTTAALLPDVELGAGESVLVVGGRTEVTVPAGEMLIVLDTTRIGNGLRNAGDRVALVDPFGTRHDAVSWGDQRVPSALSEPTSGQSIVRQPSGRTRLTSTLTPWSVSNPAQVVRVNEDVAPHESRAAIVELDANPIDGGAESVTIKNVSDDDLLTINWSLSMGTRSATIPSWRLTPGERRTFTINELGLLSGFNHIGGSLILRDQRGHWLSAVSWGSDDTFHNLPAPTTGEVLRFSQSNRVRPLAPWWQRQRDLELLTISNSQSPSRLGTDLPSIILRHCRASLGNLAASKSTVGLASARYPSVARV